MRIVSSLPNQDLQQSSADPAVVQQILFEVRTGGDAALAHWTQRLDRAVPQQRTLAGEALAAAAAGLPQADLTAITTAAANIRQFAQWQRAAIQPFEHELQPGFFVGQRLEPIERVACYVPGGRYPLPSTVLMTAIPAREAGCKHVAVWTPPGPNGLPHQAILAAAVVAGVDAVHIAGGAQAIAAAAYGTETIAPADIIVGPGNAWVTEAKRQVYGTVGIDALAGPSEVMVLLDASAHLGRVAADLLAQAEHDPDAHAIAVTCDAAVAVALQAEVERQLASLPTREVAQQALEAHGLIVVVATPDDMAELANQRAPEHLEVHLEDAEAFSKRLHSYGGLFVGTDAAEVLGDYCAGPSHVLPTMRAGRYTGGLGVPTFLRVLTTQRALPGAASQLAPIAAQLARMEGLEAHARAADARCSKPSNH
jgi:sulfopropanediol 3-dehydrogenase